MTKNCLGFRKTYCMYFQMDWWMCLKNPKKSDFSEVAAPSPPKPPTFLRAEELEAAARRTPRWLFFGLSSVHRKQAVSRPKPLASLAIDGLHGIRLFERAWFFIFERHHFSSLWQLKFDSKNSPHQAVVNGWVVVAVKENPCAGQEYLGITLSHLFDALGESLDTGAIGQGFC